ncbi:MAG: L-aspartate oxidase [Bdellovibrionales bacterium]
MKQEAEVLIIGSGLAGLALALKLAPSHQVTVVSKAQVPINNTAMAQGGIAAVQNSAEDSFAKHVQDTLQAGAGLCDVQVVTQIIEQAPARVQDLLNWGVRFDIKDGQNNFDLTREGGHQARRILHHGDQTGAEIHAQLLARVRGEPHITLLEEEMAVELICERHRVVGAYILKKADGQVTPFLSKATVLATGGAGKVYLYTSNWHGATGDGIALAYRAGARVGNLEFMQFHPTCLYHPQARNFLISEALRGEGGVLRNRHDEAFMGRYHPMASLAPRDIVARAIDNEMKKSGDVCVFLDLTHKPKDFLLKRFPAIYAKCLEHGIDMSMQPIPVVPAAHYLCGGVMTDVNGRTSVEGLYAIGETACTGLHGANRLASNSLLECIAMAHNCAEELKLKLPHWHFSPAALAWGGHDKPDADELVVVAHTWDEIRRLMWNYVGIVRSNRRLQSAKRRLETIWREVQEQEAQFKIHPEIVELRNLALVAKLTVECALQRQESRGIHYSLDFPDLGAQALNTVIEPSSFKTDQA